jgi:hypothetical protein
VVVTDQHVIYNACASAVLVVVDLETFASVRYVDERPGFVRSLLHVRSGVSNLVEALARANLPSSTHSFVKAVRIARGSTLDGSYGLQRSPCGRYLLSAHRGLNEVLVYRYPSFALHRRIKFPPIRRFYPQHLGLFDDTRLGFHHSALRAVS